MKDSPKKRQKRLCIVATSPMSLWLFYSGMCGFLSSEGYDVTCVAGAGEEYYDRLRRKNIKVVEMPFVRRPNPLADAWCLLKLWWYFLWNRYDIIHPSTPKAMLLGSLAAFLSGHWNVVITVHGRAYESAAGWKRWLFEFVDNIAFRCAKYVIPVSQELGNRIVESGCPARKIRFEAASCSGVDTKRFSLTETAIAEGNRIRRRFDIAESASVILFVGRIREEKGINELVRAFESLESPRSNRVHLVLLGPDELNASPIDPDVEKTIRSHKNIHVSGYVQDTVPWYAMANIVAFPSYREGFGNVSIEAAAMELPVVGTDIMGIREGVVDGVTGILVPVRTVEPLAHGLQRLVDDEPLCKEMGHSGRKRVERDFQPEQIWRGVSSTFNG